MIDFAILFSVWICKESKYIFFLNVVAYHSHQGRGTPLCSSFQERRSRGRNAEIFSSASCKNSSQAPYHVPRSRSSVPTSLELGDYVAYKQVDCVEDFNIVHSLQILVTPLNCTGGCHIFGMASTVSRYLRISFCLKNIYVL